MTSPAPHSNPVIATGLRTPRRQHGGLRPWAHHLEFPVEACPRLVPPSAAVGIREDREDRTRHIVDTKDLIALVRAHRP
jgi:hypothetical protein